MYIQLFFLTDAKVEKHNFICMKWQISDRAGKEILI